MVVGFFLRHVPIGYRREREREREEGGGGGGGEGLPSLLLNVTLTARGSPELRWAGAVINLLESSSRERIAREITRGTGEEGKVPLGSVSG